MCDFKNPKNISIANLRAVVGEPSPAPRVEGEAEEPRAEEHTITDSSGTTYSVRLKRSNDLWDMTVWHNERQVGLANCADHGESLFLGNIEIFSTAAPPAAAEGEAAEAAAPPYRGRGVGASLLRFIIAQARLNGTIQEITGHLMPQHLQDKPDLPAWYERRGFEVRMNEDGCGGTIRYNLERNQD